MNIIGIHTGHTATAALIVKNKLEAAVSEEKFTNRKNQDGFPINSINFLLKSYGLNASDIDFVAVSDIYNHATYLPGPEKNERTICYTFLAGILSKHIRFSAPFLEAAYLKYRRNEKKTTQKPIKNLLNKFFGFKESQVVFVHHHLCHAYAPIGFYNLHKEKEPILVITQDGYGDTLCGSIGEYKDGKYTLLDTTSFVDSTALIYGAVTQYFGMKMTEHEHKVMGLAAYPPQKYGMQTYKSKFEDLVKVADGKISLKYKTFHSLAFCDSVLRERLHRERFDNIAFGVQQLVESKICEFVIQNVRKYKINNIAVGGGLFMNVKLNKKLQELDEINKCFFMPSCGDETNAIGAAFYVLENHGEFGVSDETMYLGKEYKDEEIEQFFAQNGLDKKYRIEKSKNIAKHVAELVNDGKIVGRFAGRGEVGARSLGNRAILADPSKLESIELINYTIKSRDFWMPFACSVLDYRFEDYAIFNKKSHPYYMITTYDSTEQGKKFLKAGIHRKDFTMRPNVVKQEHNREYCEMIKQYEKLSGIGGILNTSLNIHGYPLIGFINELFFTMENSDLNIAQCGNFIIEKKK